ncbi:Citrate lyase, beta subunit [mine drainage metagenome]|uniref:Citrate lyase, beta subunit n=2 Tax=mine drainage metagenome TaxID=410659 RepID=T0ZMJ2_9ZZZZ
MTAAPLGPPPYRRCELSTPASNERMLAKASRSEVDLVVADLEDGVAPSRKEEARRTLVRAATELDWAGKALAFRPNALDTPWFLDDVTEVLAGAGKRVDALVLPKVKTAEEVAFVARLLLQLERKFSLPSGRIALEILVETASGVLAAEAIARASPRVQALLFGLYDLSGDLGTQVTAGWALDLSYARQRTLVCARAAGVLALDGITARYQDLDLTRQEAENAHRLGFDGKWAIHPDQVPVIQEVFTPGPEELEAAARRVRAHREAGTTQGKGAFALDGEMVDEATVRLDVRRLALGRKLGLLPALKD